MSNRVIVVSAAALGALILALIVAVIILIATVNGQADEAAYRACMERLDPGYTSATGVEEYATDLADNAAFCDR